MTSLMGFAELLMEREFTPEQHSAISSASTASAPDCSR
jgi:hypothetical protein